MESAGLGDESSQQSPNLAWFGHMRNACDSAQRKFESKVSEGKSLSSMLTSVSRTERVSDSPCQGRAVKVNSQVFDLMSSRPAESRSVPLSVREATTLETALRGVMESYNFQLWTVTALFRFLGDSGCCPMDDPLLDQFQRSFSRGAENVAASLASTTAFVTAKRRESFLSPMFPSVTDAQKRKLLSDPVFDQKDPFAPCVFLSSTPVFLRFLSLFPFRFFDLLLCWFSFSLSLAFSFSCLFSIIGNAVQGCLSVRFAFVCRFLFLCSGFVFYVPERGGSPVLFVFCESVRDTLMFVSSALWGVLLSLFLFCFWGFHCCSVFYMLCLLLWCPVPASLLRVFFLLLFVTSDCRLPLLFFSSRCPVHLCLFLFPWSLSLPWVAYLASSLRLSSWWSFLPLSCGCFFFLSLPLAPVSCFIHFASLSSLRWL